MNFLPLLAGTLLVLMQATMPAAAQAPSPARAALTVVADDNYPPYVFRGPDGAIDGYLVELWKLWEHKTGVKVDFVASDWAKAKATMAAGRADVIDTIFDTPERRKTLDFTAPYADLPVSIYAHRDIAGITSTASLRGFLVAAKAGDACIEQLQAAGVTSPQQFDSYQQIVDAAVADRVRVFCMDEPPANYLLSKIGAHQQYRKAFNLDTGQFHRAVRKGDVATLALVQRGFDAIGRDEAAALRDKWMGSRFDPLVWGRPLAYGLAAALLATLLVLGWGMALRRTVHRRTAELQEQRQRLRTLLDTLPDMVSLKGLDGRYITCNRAFERLYGTTEDRIVGRTDSDFVAAEAAASLHENDRLAVESDDSCISEEWLTFKEGGARALFETIRTPMRDNSATVVGVLAIARDVTAQHEVQRRLERQNRLHRVLDGVGDTIATTRERQALFDAVCHVIVVEGGFRMAWIGAPDAAGRIQALARAGSGLDYPDEARISIHDVEFGREPTGIAFRERRTAVAMDLTHDPATRPWHDAARARNLLSTASFPIVTRDEACAVLAVYADRVDYFDAGELRLLERLALQIGIALEAAEADAARSRAQSELRASEQRFAAVFRTSPVAMALGRMPEGCYVDVNEAWLELFGYQRHEVIGRTGLDLGLWCDLRDRDRFRLTCEKDGHIDNFDVVMNRRGGARVEISLAAVRVEIGGERHLVSSLVDVSLRRQSERSLAQQAEQLERMVAQRTGELSSIFQALPDLYFRIAADGTILDFRAGRDSDLFTTPEQFLGRRVQDVLPGETGAMLARALQSVRERHEPIAVEYSLPLPAGVGYFEARMLPFRDGEVISVIRNISERKAFEQGREKARAEIERLSQLRSEFLANMSHEIRTPLNGIMGLAQMGRAGQDLKQAEAAFSRIVGLSRQLLRIVNDILDFSKIDANQLEIESVALDPGVLAEETADIVRDAARDKGLSLSVQRAPELPARCVTDPLRLQQILLNLLTNSIKFTGRGGDVRLWVGCEDASLVVRVSDTGIGISEAQLRQLFVPFRQADSSTTRRFGGTGLGLSISRRLAQLMGGDIVARSEPGRGSVFELRMPLQRVDIGTPADEQAGTWRATQRRLQGLRLLVAEDNPVNQIIIGAALTTEGAAVTIVDDGQQAVERVRSDGGSSFDLVLMDLQMPVMDGYAATRHIREFAPELPIVGQTAHAMPEDRDRCLAAGMVAHVAKPIDLEQLVTTVQEHTQRNTG